VAFADYNIPLRTELLPEHIKGTSQFYKDDGRYYIEIEGGQRAVEFINGH
jgi:hypothetical protein